MDPGLSWWNLGFRGGSRTSMVEPGVLWWIQDFHGGARGSMLELWVPQWSRGFCGEARGSSVELGVLWWLRQRNVGRTAENSSGGTARGRGDLQSVLWRSNMAGGRSRSAHAGLCGTRCSRRCWRSLSPARSDPTTHRPPRSCAATVHRLPHLCAATMHRPPCSCAATMHQPPRSCAATVHRPPCSCATTVHWPPRSCAATSAGPWAVRPQASGARRGRGAAAAALSRCCCELPAIPTRSACCS